MNLSKDYEREAALVLLQIFGHVPTNDINSNDGFVLFTLLVQWHLLGTVSIKKLDATKQLPTTSVHKYWMEEKK